MSDRSYMQITIYDCPTKRRQVAELLEGYVGLNGNDPPEVAVGEQYTVEEISLGSISQLAAELIELAPRCSFIGWQDPFEQYLGEMVAYCPKWGRFDGDCTGEGHVVLGHHAITAIVSDPGNAYLARDTLLRLHADDMVPAQLAAWQARPGLAEAIEVAYGVPWLQHPKGIKPPNGKKLAWAAIIDRRHKEAAEARHALLGDLAGHVEQLGLASHAQALRDATDPAQAPGTARSAADACSATLETITGAMTLLTSLLGEQEADTVKRALYPFAYLPARLRGWADGAEEAHAGRRRP